MIKSLRDAMSATFGYGGSRGSDVDAPSPTKTRVQRSHRSNHLAERKLLPSSMSMSEEFYDTTTTTPLPGKRKAPTVTPLPRLDNEEEVEEEDDRGRRQRRKQDERVATTRMMHPFDDPRHRQSSASKVVERMQRRLRRREDDLAAGSPPASPVFPVEENDSDMPDFEGVATGKGTSIGHS